MKKLNVKLFFTAFLSVLFLGSCLKTDDDLGYYPQAAFTMVNAFAPAQAVVYRADNNTIQSPMNPLNFKSYTFAYLFPGNRRIQAISSNNKMIVDTLYAFKDSTYYTSFVYGTEAQPRHLISTDKLLGTLDTKSAVRFLHLGNNTGKVDVFIGNTDNAIFGDRAFSTSLQTEETKFIPHESGKQRIIIKDNEASNQTLVDREYDFEPGVHYSIILIGDKNSTETPLYIGVVKQY